MAQLGSDIAPRSTQPQHGVMIVAGKCNEVLALPDLSGSQKQPQRINLEGKDPLQRQGVSDSQEQPSREMMMDKKQAWEAKNGSDHQEQPSMKILEGEASLGDKVTVTVKSNQR